jgi:hypothetical protein
VGFRRGWSPNQGKSEIRALSFLLQEPELPQELALPQEPPEQEQEL